MNPSDHWRLAVIGLATLLLAVLAWSELKRVEQGSLLLLRMPWESLPSRVEVVDANRTASRYLGLAPCSILGIGLVVACVSMSPDTSARRKKYWNLLVGLLIVAALADMATTIWFFHAQGIDHEVHPAIRLLGYAYGRTWGPIFGKLIQTAGIIYLSLCLRRIAPWIMVIASVHYFGAAIYNLSTL